MSDNARNFVMCNKLGNLSLASVSYARLRRDYNVFLLLNNALVASDSIMQDLQTRCIRQQTEGRKNSVAHHRSCYCLVPRCLPMTFLPTRLRAASIPDARFPMCQWVESWQMSRVEI